MKVTALSLCLGTCLLLAGCAGGTPPQEPATQLAERSQADENCRPVYPPEARALRQQGKVLVRVLVDTSGTVTKAAVIESSGVPALDKAALEHVTSSCVVYQAGKRRGVPATMVKDIPVRFVLDKERTSAGVPQWHTGNPLPV